VHYRDFTIRARDWDNGEFKVEVTDSPADRMREPAVVRHDATACAQPLRDLERKRIRRDALIALGEQLASLILPPPVRDMFRRSLDAIGADHGLRLRLVLDDPRLADLPWEYIYLARASGDRALDGFLALDPRISIVRHEAIPEPVAALAAGKPLRMVVGLASPSDQVHLDLAREREWIERTLGSVENLSLEIFEALTLEKLESAVPGAHIFHFAGHGVFGAPETARGPGATRDMLAGNVGMQSAAAVEPVGAILLESTHGGHLAFPAEKLALTLRAAGVRVVVLGACETGRRDGVNVWTGVAPTLTRAGIPAVLAMQHGIYDDSAIAFARRFYESLAASSNLDEAVASGRLAILNQRQPDDVDWGVPVLYLRSSDGVVFPEDASDARAEPPRVTVRQRIGDLEGAATGIDADVIRTGTIDAEQTIDRIAAGGDATAVVVGTLEGGAVTATQDSKSVAPGGALTGVKIGRRPPPSG